ncbi:MAG TPA: preprotein translocase subunit SecG [Verrucomicrobiae bacterium]|nr:preprotein translocase subunit SecG [Verrucomicrobiae bacterium]
MYTLLIILHIIVAVCLIISVLMQSAKGEGLAGAFGGGTFSSTVFGGRGAATFLARATAILALVFALTSVGLTMIKPSSSAESAVQKAAGTIPMPQQQAPVNVQQGPDAQPAAGQPAEPNVFDPNAPGSQKPTEQKSATPK